MADNQIQMPGAFGGLMRYSEEYSSKINLSPTQIILFIVLIIVFRFALPLFLS